MDNSVYVVKCENYNEEIVRNTLLEVFSNICADEFIKPGMKIGIKVNLVTAMKPDKAVTTHPTMVSELCKIISQMGAFPIVGDSPGGIFNPAVLKRIYSVTGMDESEQYGAILNFNCEKKQGHFKQAKSAKTFEYTAWLDDVDLIINFSKLKTHAMMGLSAAVKNMFGSVPGTTKPEYHLRFPQEERFADMLIDLIEYFKPCLNIVDAVIGMEGNGPTAGNPRYIGAVIAGVSPYNVDMVCSEIVGAKTKEVSTITAAQKRGLCPDNLSEINVIGNIDEIKIDDFELIHTHKGVEFFFDDESIIGKAMHSISKSVLNSTPLPKKAMCIGCEKCREICPAKAIIMKNAIPIIDRKKCIRCFCCQEFCLTGAMKVHRPILAKIASKL